MEIKEVQKFQTEIITDIICDSCGKSCKVDEYIIRNDARIDNGEKDRIFEYMELKAVWGYNTKKDMETWAAHICENCVDEKLSTIINFNKRCESPILVTPIHKNI